VFSFGGHDDLPRVLRYLCTGQEPFPPGQVRLKAAAGGATDAREAPFTRPPHDYGVAGILLGVADRIVPAAPVEPGRAAVRRYLWASALDGGVDRSRAAAEFDAVRAAGQALPEPSRTLVRYTLDRDVIHLGARLLPYVSRQGSDPALSLSRSPKPSVPAFLRTGIYATVTPPSEP